MLFFDSKSVTRMPPEQNALKFVGVCPALLVRCVCVERGGEGLCGGEGGMWFLCWFLGFVFFSQEHIWVEELDFLD